MMRRYNGGDPPVCNYWLMQGDIKDCYWLMQGGAMTTIDSCKVIADLSFDSNKIHHKMGQIIDLKSSSSQ